MSLEWTKQPTRMGWYWMYDSGRPPTKENPEVVWVDSYANNFFYFRSGNELNYDAGNDWFLGPIEQPTNLPENES